MPGKVADAGHFEAVWLECPYCHHTKDYWHFRSIRAVPDVEEGLWECPKCGKKSGVADMEVRS